MLVGILEVMERLVETWAKVEILLLQEQYILEVDWQERRCSGILQM